MSLETFKKEWLGKKYIEPWMSTAECVWLWKLWSDYIKKPTGSFGWSAIKWWDTDMKNWRRIDYKFWLEPAPGDLAFQAPKKWNPYGHVVVVLSGGVLFSRILEQNWHKGSGTWMWKDAIRERIVPTSSFLGWKTPKF